MNQQSLRALLLDRELGELSPEASLLLETYLSEHPEWENESRDTVELLRLASETIRRFPERGHAVSSPVSLRHGSSNRILALAAAIVLFAGFALFTAYRIGRGQSIAAESPATSTPPPRLAAFSARTSMPWARYELQPTHRGYTVVPLANSNSNQNP